MTNSAAPDQKPTELELHCLQRLDISGVGMTRVKVQAIFILGQKAMVFLSLVTCVSL